jgi:carbonic anhydrase
LFGDQVIGGLLENSLETASIDAQGWHDHGRGPGSHEGRYIKWHTFTDLNASVVEDVRRIRAHPLVPGRIPTTATSTTFATGGCWTCRAQRRPGP